MGKLINVALATMIVLSSATPARDRFANYKAIEAYEVRPGIMMMPRYSADGQVCEIGIEKLHYTPEVIRLDSDLPRKEIDEIFDELVPIEERGPRSKDFQRDVIMEAGQSIETTRVFQNVTFQISAQELSRSRHRGIIMTEIVATVHWNNRKCQ
jgi:hypothetical protein